MTTKFDWENSDEVVVKPRYGIAVYPSTKPSFTVILQQGITDDEDSFILVERDDIPALIAALEAVIAAPK